MCIGVKGSRVWESGVEHGRVKTWKVDLPEKVPNEEFQSINSIFMALPTSVKRKTRKSKSLSPGYKQLKDVEEELISSHQESAI